MFLHLSVILFTGWGCLGPGPGGGLGVWPRGVQAHTRGGFPGPDPGGCPGPGPEGGVSQHALRQTPPNRRLLLRAVRILLKCIVVWYNFCRKLHASEKNWTERGREGPPPLDQPLYTSVILYLIILKDLPNVRFVRWRVSRQFLWTDVVRSVRFRRFIVVSAVVTVCDRRFTGNSR